MGPPRIDHEQRAWVFKHDSRCIHHRSQCSIPTDHVFGRCRTRRVLKEGRAAASQALLTMSERVDALQGPTSHWAWVGRLLEIHCRPAVRMRRKTTEEGGSGAHDLLAQGVDASITI